MRLEFEQVADIKSVLSVYIKAGYKVYLYGSRTQDHLKGGDIDLLIVTDDEGLQSFNTKKFDILVDIKKRPSIGQRKIDIKAVLHEQIESDSFVKHIWESCVLL